MNRPDVTKQTTAMLISNLIFVTVGPQDSDYRLQLMVELNKRLPQEVDSASDAVGGEDSATDSTQNFIEVDFKDFWLRLGELEAALRNTPGIVAPYYTDIIRDVRGAFQNEGVIKHKTGALR